MWNLRTFKLYNTDLWGSLLLSSSLTRPLKYLLKFRYKTKFYSKSSYEYNFKAHTKRSVKFRFLNTFFNRYISKKGYYRYRQTPDLRRTSDRVLKLSKGIKTVSYNNYYKIFYNKSRKNRFNIVPKFVKFSRSYKLWNRLSTIFRNRYQFSFRKPNNIYNNRRGSYKGSKFIIDYTKPKTFDKLRVKIKRRNFSSQRILDIRKFTKFYGNISKRQFYCLISEVKFKSIDLNKKYSLFYNLLSRLEKRLDVLLFRSGLVTSIFMAKHLISYGHIFINGCKVKSLNRVIGKYDMVSFGNLNNYKNSLTNFIKFLYLRRWYSYSFFGSKKRSKLKLVLLSLFYPKYLEVDFKTFSFILIADVFYKDVFFPFKLPVHDLSLFVNRVRAKLKN